MKVRRYVAELPPYFCHTIMKHKISKSRRIKIKTASNRLINNIQNAVITFDEEIGGSCFSEELEEKTTEMIEEFKNKFVDK